MADFLKAEVAKVDEDLGLVFGFSLVSKVGDEPYFDSQGDHIPEDAMLKASVDFMLKSRMSGDMHARDESGAPIGDGDVVFAFPLTADIAKAMDITTKFTGLMIAMRPSAAVLAKYRDGTYKGFSIGGRRVVDEDV